MNKNIRHEICRDIGKKTNGMNYKVIEKNSKKYIECVSIWEWITKLEGRNQQDGKEII
jgi:hypothetical protein